MTIAVRPRGEDAALRYEVAGRLDLVDTQQMRAVERPAEPHSVVEIDLRDCDGMDDFAFGSLVGLIRRAREHDAEVHVVDAGEGIRRELRRSGLARLVTLRSSSAPRRASH